MSEANVEVVRRVYAAAARRDPAAVLAEYDPEVEWDVSRSHMARLVGEGVYQGHDGLRRFFRAYHDAWEDVSYGFDKLIDAGEDKVVSVDIEHARGRSSGADVEMTQYAIWTIRNGKIIRAIWFANRAEAFEAAGLSD
jgi:ketosteroid isomerase-like protein